MKMKGVDRGELNNATIVSHALVMAILTLWTKRPRNPSRSQCVRISRRHPNRLDGQPVDEAMWKGPLRN